jgi:TolA-binding protein
MAIADSLKKWFPYILASILVVGLIGLALRHYQSSSKDRLQPLAGEDMPSDQEEPEWANALTAYEKGDYILASELLESFLSTNPEHTEGLYYLGLCLLETGQEARAADLMEQVRINDPSYYPEATWHLALAHVKEGDTQEARILMTELAGGEDAFYSEKARVFLDEIME